MTKKLMKDDPPVVSWILVLLEGFRLGRIDKGAGLSFVAFGTHSVGNDNVLETALFADVVILLAWSHGA